MKCPKCGSQMCEEKAINLRTGAERMHWHCPTCNYDTLAMYESHEKKRPNCPRCFYAINGERNPLATICKKCSGGGYKRRPREK